MVFWSSSFHWFSTRNHRSAYRPTLFSCSPVMATVNTPFSCAVLILSRTIEVSPDLEMQKNIPIRSRVFSKMPTESPPVALKHRMPMFTSFWVR